jgi:hypothetical protein
MLLLAILFFSDRESEKDSCNEWSLAIADNESRLSLLSKDTQDRVLNGTACIYIGAVSSKYCHDLTTLQLMKGSRLYIKWSFNKSRIEGGNDFQQWLYFGCSFQPFGNISICNIAPVELNAKDVILQMIGEGGAKVMQWQDQYRFETHHQRSTPPSEAQSPVVHE